MKKLLLILFIGLGMDLSAQKQTLEDTQEYLNTSEKTIFLGPGISINEAGLHICVSGKIAPRFYLSGLLGTGLWGRNLGGAIEFNPSKTGYKSSIGLGLKTHPGTEVTLGLTTLPNNQEEEVDVRFNPGTNIFFTYGYNMELGNENRFQIFTGWSVDLTENNYTVLTKDVKLTLESQSIMEFMAPGGLIFGFRFLFGVN